MTPREAAARAALAKASGRQVMLLSGVTGQGVPEVLRALQTTAVRCGRRSPRAGGGRGGGAAPRPLPNPPRAREREMSRMTPSLASAQRLVVKIGSALVVDQDEAAPRTAWLDGVAADIASLRARGADVIVVSSGAIALARRSLGLQQRRLRLEEQQAAAAVGQIRLAQAWSEALSAKGLTAAQLLLTLDDTEDRRRYLNARATLNTLLGLGCIPVINENDTVATAEIRFGDNDRLAARVAEMMQADQLVLLSDIDGLYTADPRRDPAAAHIPVVCRHHAGDRGDGWRAAARLFLGRHAHQAGRRRASPRRPAARWRSPTAISSTRLPRWRRARAAPGSSPRRKAVRRASAGSLVRWRRWARWWWMPARRARWPRAVRCCRPACARSTGTFERGDPVVVRGPDGTALARGLSAYASADAERIAGHRSDEIEAILGWRGRDEIIHRDDLVLL